MTYKELFKEVLDGRTIYVVSFYNNVTIYYARNGIVFRKSNNCAECITFYVDDFIEVPKTSKIIIE